jgi:hypothetical protein
MVSTTAGMTLRAYGPHPSVVIECDVKGKRLDAQAAQLQQPPEDMHGINKHAQRYEASANGATIDVDVVQLPDSSAKRLVTSVVGQLLLSKDAAGRASFELYTPTSH